MSSIVIKGGLLVVDAEGKDKIFPVQGNVMFDFYGKAKASTLVIGGNLELSLKVAQEIMAVDGASTKWWKPNTTVDKVARKTLSLLMGREDVSIVFYGESGMYVIDGGFGYYPGDTELHTGIVLGSGKGVVEDLTYFNPSSAHQILAQVVREETQTSGFFPAQALRYS